MSHQLKKYKIIVLGSGGVGKTALTMRLVTDSFNADYDPTIEDSYRKQVDIDDVRCQLDITDTAGQQEYSLMMDQWIRNGQGYLLVFDITNKQSFDKILEIYEKILRVKDDGSIIPTVIAGNKCDIRNERDPSQVDRKTAIDQAKEWGCPYYETSAKDQIDNEECFYQLVREIRKKEALEQPIKRQKKRRCVLL